MDSKALVVMNYRQLAMVYEQMEALARDDSVHISERQEAQKLHKECANLMGRDPDVEQTEL
jgi:hypothetical protein